MIIGFEASYDMLMIVAKQWYILEGNHNRVQVKYLRFLKFLTLFSVDIIFSCL